jgi:putative cell wall-binding protein
MRGSARIISTLALTAALLVPLPASAQEGLETEGAGSDNMSHVANLEYELRYDQVQSYGTDIEFVTLHVPGDAPPGGEPPVDDAPEPPEAPDVVSRSGGADRIATAAAISGSTFRQAETVILARADVYADALAGAPLATSRRAPLLLSESSRLSAAAAQEIERLGAEQVILLGGQAALSEQVEEDLRTRNVRTSRIGGADRFDTAGLIHDRIPSVTEVFIAEGANADDSRGWPDALSASGLAATTVQPVLLVTRDVLPPQTAQRLSAERAATIVGGTAAVSEEVADEIDERSGTVTRLSGATRYATSAAVAEEAIRRDIDPATTWVATGRAFPDGLTASAAAGATRGVLVLVDGMDLDGSPETLAWIRTHADRFEALRLAGGEAAISRASADRLRELVESEGASASEGGDSASASSVGFLHHAREHEPHDGIQPEPGSLDDPVGEGEPRDFALAGTYRNGLQIIDITHPENPEVAAVYDCAMAQGDVQAFRQGDRTFAAYTADVISSHTFLESQCYADVGFDEDGDKSEAYGTFIVDITDPYDPQTVSFVPVRKGSHNQTVHPSGEWMYNSNSSLVTSPPPYGIEIIDLRDIEHPEVVGELELPLFAGLGSESHDITFSTDGTRAYSAAVSQTHIIDTTDPANPEIITTIRNPAIDVHHQSDPITIGDETFLVITDEQAGAIETGDCPGGGLYVYDITDEESPSFAGAFFIPEIRPAVNPDGSVARCTAHVLRMHPDEGIMTIAWYNGGVRVIDISTLAGLSLGSGSGMEEIGFYRFDDSDLWSAKTNRFAEDGSFYIFGNDVRRGLDVFHFDASDTAVETAGTWLTPAEVHALVEARPERTEPLTAPYCLLPTLTS